MHLLLDTDIGSDVDDALALTLIYGSHELVLDAIATVYGDTRLRAQLARRYLKLAGAGSGLEIAAGIQKTLSGRDVWWAGHEGQLFDDLESEEVGVDGVEMLRRRVASSSERLDVLAIGPLTNIAVAIQTDPGFEAAVRRLVIMGGDFGAQRVAEHNFKSDVIAAQRVFASKMDIVVGGLDLTEKIRLTRADVEEIGRAGELGRVLAREIEVWWEHNGAEWNTPHDPILALWMARPDLFSSTRARVDIDAEGKSWAFPDESGNVTIIDAPDPEMVRGEIVRRIVAGARGAVTGQVAS